MPRGLLSCCIAGLFSLWASIAVASGPTSTIRDPLFGLSLNPDMGVLERTDPGLISRCGIGGAGSEQRSWVFAATSASDGEYLILGGLARTLHGSAAGPWIQDWQGELVRVNEHDCTVIDPPREALMYPTAASIPLTKAVIDGLAANAVYRLSSAFGSRERFVTELRQQGVYPEHAQLKPLRDAIETSTLP